MLKSCLFERSKEVALFSLKIAAFLHSELITFLPLEHSINLKICPLSVAILYLNFKGIRSVEN